MGTVGELLSASFDELSATPGIGEKKINSLVKLLNRAMRDEPPAVSDEGDSPSVNTMMSDSPHFDPNIVSEALWTEWREMVRRFDVVDERLGRLAPSLQRLPTVIWHKSLSEYLDHTLAEIRNLRTHGEKRVRCVLEVFHSVYHKLLQADASTNLERLLMPRAIRDVQDWCQEQLSREQVPTEDDVRERFARPLLRMIDVDCGETVLKLVEERLGLNTEARSVREQARHLGVTRARVYQLLDDCGKVMSVRWPEGKSLLARLTSHYSPLEQRQGQLRLFFGLCEICFPEKQGAVGNEAVAILSETAESPGLRSPTPTVNRIDPGEHRAADERGTTTESADLPPAANPADKPSAIAKGEPARITISTST